MIVIMKELLLVLVLTRLSIGSWIKVINSPTVLQSEVHISYKIDNFDPARFNDIHSLVYAGSELLYAIRVSGGEAVLRVPCGVVTHAGTHSVTLCYTNNTVIATCQFHVSWPRVAVSVPHRIETYTVDVGVTASFTTNVCSPLTVRGNNNNQRVLQGGKRGVMPVWLSVQRCETMDCDEVHLVNIVKVDNFWSQPRSPITIPCDKWGVAGVHRVMLGVQMDGERNMTREDTTIVVSRHFYVDWSTEYKLKTHKDHLDSCPLGDSVIVETDYPSCVLERDKIRLYRQSTTSMARPTYVGEQRVIRGDKAVVFPCSMFNVSSVNDVFCFHYVSTATDGGVSTVKTNCLPVQDNGDDIEMWTPWGSWSQCSVSCGEGVRSRYRFCTRNTFFCQGPRIETATCSEATCPPTPAPTRVTPEVVTTGHVTRPTPVYGASPCECGCTYILHYTDSDMDSTRDINIVSGDCNVFPVTWTVKVPDNHQMLMTVQNVSFTCPGLQLNIRDGVDNLDTLLYTIHEDTNVSVSVRTSHHVSRLELVSDTRKMNTTFCYAILHVDVIIKEYSQPGHVVSSLRSHQSHVSELDSLLQLSTPILLVVSLMFLIVICTMIMLCDYQYKKKKYSVWKAGLMDASRSSSPMLGAEFRQCSASMTDISTVSDYDYAPLLPASVSRSVSRARLCPAPTGGSKSVPVTPVVNHRRRRLLRRSETVEDYKVKMKKPKRKLSLPQKISRSKLYMSVSTIDRDADNADLDDKEAEYLKESSDKISDIKSASTRLKKVGVRKRRSKRRSMAESSESDLTRTGSERTLQPGSSTSRISASNCSEFSSCVSLAGQELDLEYDLYDCHIDNVMAAPGSMFAPAYWPDNRTPSLELEMGDLFPSENCDTPGPLDTCESSTCSPVTLRHTRQDTCLISSMTSDLTASISSAVSNTTLVGETRDNVMDISCYHSNSDEEEVVELVVDKKKNIMNLTHIEDDIQFVDD